MACRALSGLLLLITVRVSWRQAEERTSSSCWAATTSLRFKAPVLETQRLAYSTNRDHISFSSGQLGHPSRNTQITAQDSLQRFTVAGSEHNMSGGFGHLLPRWPDVSVLFDSRRALLTFAWLICTCVSSPRRRTCVRHPGRRGPLYMILLTLYLGDVCQFCAPTPMVTSDLNHAKEVSFSQTTGALVELTLKARTSTDVCCALSCRNNQWQRSTRMPHAVLRSLAATEDMVGAQPGSISSVCPLPCLNRFVRWRSGNTQARSSRWGYNRASTTTDLYVSSLSTNSVTKPPLSTSTWTRTGSCVLYSLAVLTGSDSLPRSRRICKEKKCNRHFSFATLTGRGDTLTNWSWMSGEMSSASRGRARARTDKRTHSMHFYTDWTADEGNYGGVEQYSPPPRLVDSTGDRSWHTDVVTIYAVAGGGRLVCMHTFHCILCTSWTVFEAMQKWLTIAGNEVKEEADAKKARANRTDPSSLSGQNDSNQNLLKILLLVIRLGLTNADAVRTAEACLFRTWLIPKASPYGIALKTAGRLYYDKTKGKKTHSEGPPDCWYWGAVIQVSIEHCTDSKCKDVLSKHANEVKTPADLVGRVLCCRKNETFDKNMLKLRLHVTDMDDVQNIVIRMLDSADGVVRKQGRAPPGSLERDLQKVLDDAK
eukprot:TRINITY_DN7354_c0_g1_i5.p1 TRINITY_DN7354_c0_g1~~TRINITY_DN7354_c0_g1_i5.p1  ORF type:complete len:653 (+),score=43.36 TRINITY_DN7354_c0_g1_i5:147-2105(+)